MGRRGLTGLLNIQEVGPGGKGHRLYLRRGYLFSARVEGLWAPLGELLRDAGHLSEAQLRRSLEALAEGAGFQGRALVEEGLVTESAVDDALRKQADLRLDRLARLTNATWTFSPATAPPNGQGGRPVALVHWARRHLEARLSAPEARKLLGDLCMARFHLAADLAPDEATLDELDRRLVRRLLRPTNLAELLGIPGASRPRVLALLYFLAGVGALHAGASRARAAATPPPVRPDPVARAHAVLGVDANADGDTIRRAYKNLVRSLHPDLHPGLPPVARRTLELRFAAVTAAYRSLTR